MEQYVQLEKVEKFAAGEGRACHRVPMRSTCSLYIDAGYLLASAADLRALFDSYAEMADTQAG